MKQTAITNTQKFVVLTHGGISFPPCSGSVTTAYTTKVTNPSLTR